MAAELKLNQVYDIDPERLELNKANREVDIYHLGRLKAALQRENLLHVRPITINRKYEVIDGQHRVTAAIELGFKTVPCLVVDANIHHAPKINVHSKNWNLMDYAKYWQAQGKAEYKKFLEFVAQTGIVPSNSIIILSGETKDAYIAFKEGGFKARNLAAAYRMVEQLDDISKVYPLLTRGRPFIRAFWTVSRNSGYNHERMLKKLGEGSEIKRSLYAAEYVKQLQMVYNHKTSVAERVVFELLVGQSRTDR